MSILLDNIIKSEDKYGFIGCQLPMTASPYGYFNPSTITRNQIKSNIINLILTNKGERVMNPEFGCDIYNLLFEPIDIYTIEETIQSTITSNVKRWLPVVRVLKVEVNTDPNKIDRNILEIKLSFALPGDDDLEELQISLQGGVK